MKIKYNQENIDLNPTKIIAAAKNYRKHIKEMKTSIPDEPKFFLKPPSSIIGNNETVILPAVSKRVDFEVELAVIVKKKCKNVPPQEFFNYVLGYTILVDITARDIQTRERKEGMPWAAAKGFDTFAPLGPEIIPADSINPGNLDIWLKQNGEYRQKSNTENMIFSVDKLGAFVSRIMTLEPEDIIATGTPEGVGPMSDGDKIEAGIENIGVLTFHTKRE